MSTSKPQYLAEMEKLRDERIIFIFGECHRSQFGDTHKRITALFRKHQMFGFTGTPIFAENAATVSGKSRKTPGSGVAEYLTPYEKTEDSDGGLQRATKDLFWETE